jgi:serine/threonine protein phosphatase 1
MALLMNFFQSYFIGTEPYENCTVFRPKRIKPNDLLYPKRLTLYDEIYIAHACNAHWRNRTCTSIWNIDTGAALKDEHTDVGHKRVLAERALSHFVF